MERKGIDCKKCIYYHVTWDRKFPYGCKALQFKTARLPSLEVFAASGVPCLRFEKKTIKPTENRESKGK
jgi:hypothetical protein